MTDSTHQDRNRGTASDTEEDAPRSAAARLFDIRLMIGGLFVVYGVMLTIAGFVVSDSARRKAAGIDINLWLGLGMLAVGVVFLVWRAVNPVVHTEPDDDPATVGDGGRA